MHPKSFVLSHYFILFALLLVFLKRHEGRKMGEDTEKARQWWKHDPEKVNMKIRNLEENIISMPGKVKTPSENIKQRKGRG